MVRTMEDLLGVSADGLSTTPRAAVVAPAFQQARLRKRPFTAGTIENRDQTVH
jgi:hypothetical protein